MNRRARGSYRRIDRLYSPGFVERGQLRAAYQRERRGRGIGQRFDRALINRALLFQTGQRTETGRAAGVVFEELVPGLGQAH